MIDLAGVSQQRWLEESGQCLENVIQTHLLLASGKPVLQKKCWFQSHKQAPQLTFSFRAILLPLRF